MMEIDKQLIIEEEGVKYEPYYDHLGFVTWGVGHLCDPRRPTPIAPEVVQLQLGYDLKAKREEARRFPGFDRLNEVQQAAIVSMVFQMGAEPFDGDGFKDWRNFCAAMRAGDWKLAAKHGRDSLWRREQTPARAERQMRMLESGLFVPWEVTRKEGIK